MLLYYCLQGIHVGVIDSITLPEEEITNTHDEQEPFYVKIKVCCSYTYRYSHSDLSIIISFIDALFDRQCNFIHITQIFVLAAARDMPAAKCQETGSCPLLKQRKTNLTYLSKNFQKLFKSINVAQRKVVSGNFRHAGSKSGLSLGQPYSFLGLCPLFCPNLQR